MTKISYITEEGLQKLKKDLDQLIGVERPAISKLIAEARDKGDLSENAEYEAAKEAQGMLEMKISKLKEAIAGSRIIDGSKIDNERIQVLNKVKIKNTKNNATMEYTIVPDSEADLKQGKIALSTPIAKGLIGKKVGDQVEIKVPSGTIPFEIIGISM
jgi:transcription elongation factor GreA